ncbi:cupin domain-containing protein [soil metagenome]
MPVISHASAPVFELDNATIVGLASPSRGASDIACWRVRFQPGIATILHSLTREETFFVLSGTLTAKFEDGTNHEHAHSGDALIVPAGRTFSLVAEHGPAEAICMLPVGGEAITDAGQFTPPWAR